ncbi:molybdopterin-synthase adenylyltransferase MoeB [Flavobacterium sp. WC2409]|uniref:Molybdopterin-synthase adenylyltransferase n=1 Tax=Flavobacterium sp. WC2409 TaxID=3234139 RepID=A0AB39W335_9FLAO
METTRYNRQLILPEVGENGQEKLQQAKVLLIGLGGLGAAVLPYLAAAGIGEIGLIDEDVIEVSNLQRQVIYKTASVGNSKVEEAKNRALELNPTLKINAIVERVNGKNALSLFEYYDIIVDGTDNLSTKYLINDACCVTNKPFVYGSVYKFEGQVSVFNYQDGPTYRCVFPEENAAVRNCNEAGVMGISVGIIGMFQANEVLKMVLGIGEVLTGKLLVYNILNNEQKKFEFSKKQTIKTDKTTFDHKYNVATTRNFEIPTSVAMEQINQPEVVFLDVRNPQESPKLAQSNCIQIPLSELEQELHQLNPQSKIIVFCQSGIRSKTAVAVLRKNQFISTFSVMGGMNAMTKFEPNETLFVS